MLVKVLKMNLYNGLFFIIDKCFLWDTENKIEANKFHISKTTPKTTPKITTKITPFEH